MKAFHFQTGDEDETKVSTIPERDLYLAVFNTAIHDVLYGKGVTRAKAVAWFMGAEAPITFEEVKSLFKFTESRHQKLKNYINGQKLEKRISFKRKYFHGAGWTNQSKSRL